MAAPATASSAPPAVAYMLGRGRRQTRIYHLVRPGIANHRAALCGRRPGTDSRWESADDATQAVTCESCLGRAARAEIPRAVT